MRAVETDGDLHLVNPHTRLVARTLKAREVFDRIVEMAWKTGDPGIIFLDRINRDNPTPQLGDMESTNPCGEQPLLPYEPCNLGSINLLRMLRDTGGGYEIDWDKLERTVRTSVHFLDNVIDMSRYPLDRIDRMAKGNRKIGLGVMGFADLLIRLGIPYDSEAAIRTGEEIMQFIKRTGRGRSEELAGERGVFPNFSGSRYDQGAGAEAQECDRDNGGADRHAFSYRRLFERHRTALCAVLHPARVLGDVDLPEVYAYLIEIAKARGFITDQFLMRITAGESLQRMARGAAGSEAAVRDRFRHRSGMACPHAGGIPAIYGQCRVQDH